MRSESSLSSQEPAVSHTAGTERVELRPSIRQSQFQWLDETNVVFDK